MYTENVKKGIPPRNLGISRGLRKDLQGSKVPAKLGVVVIILISMITITDYHDYKMITN